VSIRGNPIIGAPSVFKAAERPIPPPFRHKPFKRRRTLEELKMHKLDHKGQGLTEYLILLLLVSVVSIAAVKALGSTVKLKIQEARNHINSDVVLTN
jgi:Flp pilus assembly pilin Flp